MSLSGALSTATTTTNQETAGTNSVSRTLQTTGSGRCQKNQEASKRKGSATMITLAATAVTDVVVAIGSNSTTTIATSPTTGEPIAATATITTTAAAPVTMIGTTANTPTSAIVATNNTNRTNTMTTVTTTTTKPTKIRRRHKVKEFNDLISCSLCSGYLINATTIDHCGDSFCRSCILQHMKTSKHCPKCGYKINLSNLGSDELLKALIYKLVPGLYHNEIQRQIQFNIGDGKDEAAIIDSEEDYFSPVEPISLSLEYHPDSLSNFTKDQIPPVRYLQCPAAVTVHHLQRLISSKYNIDMDNARVDIEIIYEDKILSDDFSLMDVGYCYSWKRDTPLRLFYRILVHNECKNVEQVTNIDVSIVNKSEDPDEAKFVKPLKKEAAHSKTVHFKESKVLIKKEEAIKTISNKSVKKDQQFEYDDEDDDDDDATIIDDSYKNSKTTYAILKPKAIKNDDLHVLPHHNNNNNNSVSSKHKKDKDKHGQIDQPKESVKVTIIARKAGVEAKCKLGKNKSKRSSSPSKSIETSPSSDFKSLRSNDVRYMNDYSATLTPASAKQHKTKNGTKDTTKPTTPKCDIFVSIPPSGHRSSNSSDDSSENLSLAQLKTASKKTSNSVPLKQSISLDDSLLSKNRTNNKPDVPKLKITVSKKPPNAKVRKLSVEERPVEHVDLTTYAKHIGLKPINQPPVEEKREIKLKISPGNSPSSSLSSSSASSPPSAAESGFVFNPDVSTSTHKKRKKAKHSKEPKESGSKKRRLHAEISEPAAEESLKLKVKITGNPKSYKAERKASSSSDDVIITSPIATIPSPIITNTVVSTTATTTDKVKQKPLSPKPPMVNIPITSKLKPDVSSTKDVVMKPTADTVKANDIKVTKESLPVKVPTPPISVAVTKPASPRPTVATSTLPSPPAAPPTTKQPTKLQSIQDTKLPASPPLPPSLFKTAPMALQPLVLGPPKAAASPLTPKPRLQVRPADPARFKSTFAVPNPPARQPIPGSPKLSPISSIASAANRQAQLKRSASLDGTPITFAKQQKLEQDKLIRKSAYAPYMNKMPKSPTVAVASPTGNGLTTPQRNSPISITTINQPKHTESSYYTSSVTNTYTHEIQPKKQSFLSLPSSNISVTKMSEVCNIQSSPGLTITPQQQTPLLQTPIHHQKPALEILRIQSSIPPIDQQKLPINNSITKPMATKTTRPPPPTIPLVKIKRSTNQVNTFKSTVTTVTSPIQQQAVLSMNNTPKSSVEPITSAKPVNGLHSKLEPKSAESEPESVKGSSSPSSTGANVCDTSGVLDLSGKSSRSPSQDKPSPPLTPISTSQSRSVQNLTLSNLEAALNKAKQQMSQVSPTSTSGSSAPSAVNSSTTLSNSLSTLSSSTSDSSTHSLISTISSISSIGLNSTNLQNLKMLSESATSREKIAIKGPKPLTAMPKLNEISKVRQPATVRQQNASVRNIPNPSALTMRGQQVPMLTSISKVSTTVTSKTTPTSVVTTAAGSLNGGDSKQVPLSPIVTIATSTAISPTPFISSLTKPSSPIVSTTLTSSSDASKLLVSKKNLHLEQLAASLNMRAAAAAGETAAKSPPSVTPTTTATPNNSTPSSSVSSSTVTTTATLIASPLVSSSPTASCLSSVVSTTTPALSSSAVSTTSSVTAVTTPTTTSGVVSVTSSEPVVSAAES